ncbi:hypothetical protein IJJ37_00865 [Candidatus Saccharibacteria bacterium]|nr:hypothetical protein [Candidatus Saccharibacteria bacterium]
MKISGFFCGLAIAFLIVTAKAVLEDGMDKVKNWKPVGAMAAASFVLINVIYAFTETVSRGWLMFFTWLMIAGFAALTAWWIREGGRWKELFAFLLMDFILYFPLKMVAVLVGPTMSVIANIVALASACAMIVSLLLFKAKLTGKTGYYRATAAALAVALLLSLVACKTNEPPVNEEPTEAAEAAEVETSAPAPKSEPAPAPEPEPDPEWYRFLNTELLADEDSKNDFNFGVNPLPEILERKLEAGEIRLADITTKKLGAAYDLLPEEELNALVLKQLKAGEIQLADILDKPQDELYKLITAEELLAVLFERFEEDPALAAGDLAWVDFKAGTRYLGKFYDEVENNWDTAINDAKEAWMAGHDEYAQTLAAFKLFVEHAKDIKITKQVGGLDDQMYMNPFTPSGVPDVIVMESLDMSGYFLTIVINPKGGANDIEISLRVDCGFQPTNVSEMGIPVQKNPNKPTHSGGGTLKAETGGGEPQQATSSGGGEPVTFPITDPKDSSIYPVQGKNEEQGPGKDTRNGVGATMSSAEAPTSTRATGMSDGKREYWDEENERINQTQRTGGDSNAPSDRSEPVTGITDNAANGNKDTSSAPIDNRTQTSNPITLDGGRRMENTGDNSYGSFTPPGKVTETKPDTHAPSVFDGNFGANE